MVVLAEVAVVISIVMGRLRTAFVTESAAETVRIEPGDADVELTTD